MVVLGGPLIILDQFALNHAFARKSIATWRKGVEEATWNSRNDIMVSFPHAKIIKHNRARFEILHTKYRLVAEVSYKDRLVEVRFIGTHTEYDKIDPSTI